MLLPPADRRDWRCRSQLSGLEPRVSATVNPDVPPSRTETDAQIVFPAVTGDANEQVAVVPTGVAGVAV
jgi:hypothetical protein